MSDADSESEYSDAIKIPILKKSALMSKNTRKRRSKNKFQNKRRLQKCICLTLLALVLLTIIAIISFSILAYLELKNTHQIAEKQQKSKSILVLNWQRDALNRDDLKSSQCEIVLANSNDTNLWSEDYQESYSQLYDAIVVNSTAENILHDIDGIKCFTDKQSIIFATQRPLQYTNISFKGFTVQSFTKSFSYSLKSDFLWQPYEIMRLNDSKIVAPSLEPKWSASTQNFRDEHKRDLLLNEFSEPSPLALAVLQKPCHKARQNLIKLLFEHMDVHTYGECGNQTCPDNCLYLPKSHENRRYKFYLAFEEELCEDYVGENFFKALSSRLLPVVFGGANYTRFAPPNSYINARDFASIRELTDYLLYLDLNPEEHIKYFTWQDTYKVHRTESNFQTICDYLQTQSKKTSRHEQIIDWLRENKCQAYELPSTWGS